MVKVKVKEKKPHTLTQCNMRSQVLFCFILCLSAASAGVFTWNTTLPGCSASIGYIDFNTAACWNGGGLAPSVRDTAVISLNTFSFGISISSDISLARLTIRNSLVSSISLLLGKLIFNTTTANPSSLMAMGSTVSTLSPSLSLNSLRFVNASLDVSSLSQFTLDCPSVSLERSFTILAPTTPVRITWIFDSMLINGNITETHAVHHVYTSNTNATITTKNYPLSSSGPLYLWNSQSTVHFSSLEYLLQAPQVILAETVTFNSSSSLTLNETSSGTLPTIDASSSSLNWSTVVFGIEDVFPYYQMNFTLVIAKTLNADPSKVTVQPSNGDTSCQGPADVMVLYLAAYAVKPVQDFKVVRGNTPDLVRYTVSDDSHNSNIHTQLTDTTTGTHVYSLTFDYDMKTGYPPSDVWPDILPLSESRPQSIRHIHPCRPSLEIFNPSYVAKVPGTRGLVNGPDVIASSAALTPTRLIIRDENSMNKSVKSMLIHMLDGKLHGNVDRVKGNARAGVPQCQR
ncbi:hypothetical protein PROFUN_08948 [Planoprotostelium fungivorum]|uniref:Uncharacterized protein n=1 Tax=Planoprotostelium fungivorum TaxID=1890364 RepID=A0A2P6NIP1_9EUKA|nr:hypothetical protein PROFUN_08948 [Planoprotostelium fungivorum]